MTIALNASLGMILLCILLVFWGICQIIPAGSRTESVIMGALAIAAGLLIFVGR